MGSSFDGIIKANFKSAGVPRLFRKMGINTAYKVIDRLNNRFPLGKRTSELAIELTNRKYKEALSFLKQTVLNEITGKNFDAFECSVLDLLSAEEAVSLFQQFRGHANRARNMWHIYYNHDAVKAVKLLDILANEDIKNNDATMKLLTNAYSGHLSGRMEIKKTETSLASNILKICGEHKLKLSVSLLALNSPIIMHVVKELDLGTISDLFIKGLIKRGEFNGIERSAVRFMLKSLERKKAFALYEYLVRHKIIQPSERLYEHSLPADAPLNARDGHIPDTIIQSIQNSIEAARLAQTDRKVRQQTARNLTARH